MKEGLNEILPAAENLDASAEFMEREPTMEILGPGSEFSAYKMVSWESRRYARA